VDTDTVSVYEDLASQWVERRGDARDELAARFRRQVGDGLILDAGCGAGRYLGQFGPAVVGFDATAAMLRIARRWERPLVRGDLELLPFASSSLAAIFARHSYLHLPKARLPGALAEAARVLRPGGLLMASMIKGDYEGRSLPDDDFPGRWFSLWTEEELTRAFASAGFTDLTVERLERAYGAVDLLVTGVSLGRTRRRVAGEDSPVSS
jgi:SAM-dependent methyltransferase